MSVEMLQMLSFILFILSGVCLVVSVILFFTLRIPKVFGEVTGATERKAIALIQQSNEHSTGKTYRSNDRSMANGNLTGKIASVQAPVQQPTQRQSKKQEEAETQRLAVSELVPQSEETTVLGKDNYTVEVEITCTGSNQIIE